MHSGCSYSILVHYSTIDRGTGGMTYLNTINETKKKLAIVECDYETLRQKLKSYESASYIIEYMISDGTDLKDEASSLSKESFLEGVVEDWVSDSEDDYDCSPQMATVKN
ncbi:hypothetical protein R6Q59_007038 [Mikania micrantha]